MNILINCSNIRIGGGVQVSHSFLEMIKNNKAHEFTVVLSEEINEIICTNEFPVNFSFIRYNVENKIFGALFGVNNTLSNIESEHEIDVVFTVFGPSYWRPKAKHLTGFAKAQYVYRKSPYFDLLSPLDKVKLQLKQILHLRDFRRNSDILVSENFDVTNRLREKLGKKSYTVSNTYNQIFDNESLWMRNFDLPVFNGSYLLCISANYSHKNLSIIPLVIDELIDRGIDSFKFVLTINQNELKGFLPKHADYILFLGKINVNECPWLYQQCKYVFMPTLLECFSATYPEAMKMERAILTSDLFFAKAICGKSAIYFNPLDPIDIVGKLMELELNNEKYMDLITYGRQQLLQFDTARSRAEKYIKILNEI